LKIEGLRALVGRRITLPGRQSMTWQVKKRRRSRLPLTSEVMVLRAARR